MPDIPTFDKNNLPEGEWRSFRKKVDTRMVRIDGPFVVNTSEGPLTCKNGWLAIDARGYPYPIDDEEKELIYESTLFDPKNTGGY